MDLIKTITITVLILVFSSVAFAEPEGINNSICTSYNLPTEIYAGTTFQAKVTMENNGETDWTKTWGYKLGSWDERDNYTWGIARADLDNYDEIISPGEAKEFTFTITAPQQPGTYSSKWRMVQEHNEWFGEDCGVMAVNVKAKPVLKLGNIPNIFVNENGPAKIRFVNLKSNNYVSGYIGTLDNLGFRIVDHLYDNQNLLNCYLENDSIQGQYLSCDAPKPNAYGSGNFTIEVTDDAAKPEDSRAFYKMFFQVLKDNYSPSCSEINVITTDAALNEGEHKLVKSYFRNTTQEIFYVTNVRVYSSNSKLKTTLSSYNSLIEPGKDWEINVYLDADQVSNDETATVSIEYSGEFRNNGQVQQCGIPNPKVKTYTATIKNTDPQPVGPSCSDIDILTNTVYLDENTREIAKFDVRNTSTENFTIAEINTTESSSYINIYNNSVEDSSIGAGATENDALKVEIEAYSVSGDKSATANTAIEGRFSGGRTCSYSEITQPFTVEINETGNSGSDSPVLSGIPDTEVNENSDNKDNDRIIDLWKYAFDDDDSDSELYFRITQQNNTSLIYCYIEDDRWVSCEAPREDRTGRNTITVEVEDTDHNTNQDTFSIDVVSQDSGICSDISVSTKTVFMSESDTEKVSFDIRNRGDSDFAVYDVTVTENSSYVSVRNIDFDSYVNSDDAGKIEFDLVSPAVSGDKEATVTVKVRGRFDDGRSCAFSDLTRSFRVVIDNDGGSNSSICRDIDLKATDITITENTSRTKTITVENNNNNSFIVDSVRVSETSPYFRTSIRSKPSSVSANRTANILLNIETETVSRDRTDPVEVSVSGHFSNGRSCSTSLINTEFDVTVDDKGSNNDDVPVEPSGTVNLSLSKAFVSVDKGEKEIVTVTVKNDLDSRDCFTLQAYGNQIANASLNNSNVCLSSGASENVTLTLTGMDRGTTNIQVKASYGDKSKSKFVSVDVSGVAEESSIRASSEAVVDGTKVRFDLLNTGFDLRDVRISLLDAPEGIEFNDISKGLWNAGEEVTVEIETNDFEGQIDATLEIRSDAGITTLPVSLSVDKNTEEDGLATGLVGLATTAGIALGLIILLILVVLGILSIFSKKKTEVEE